MFYFFYYIPVGIDAALRKRPVLTYAYSGLCAVVFVLHRYLPAGAPVDLERLVYTPEDGTIITAIAAGFLHLGYFHLIGNLLYLLMFGRYVEDRMGGVLFATIFLGCGAIGNVLQGLFNAHVLHLSYVGILGASGAVSGILGAFSVRFLLNKLQIAYWVFMPLQAFTKGGKTGVPVLVAVAFWFLMEFVRGVIQAGGGGMKVAYVAHVSGFLLGAGTAIVSGQFKEGRLEALLRRAARYMAKGEAYAAQGEYLRYLAHRPGDAEAHAGLARAMIVTGDKVGACENYRRACEFLLDAKRRGEGEALYQEATRGISEFTLGAEYQLGLAFGLERDLKPKLALRAYEAFAATYPDHGEATFALLRAAAICANTFSDPRAADSLYRRLVERYPDDLWTDFAREERRKLVLDGD